MKLKMLPKSELPRERLMQYGASTLSNEELLSIIFRTGVKDLSVKEVSNNVLSSIETVQDLAHISIDELSSIKGVGVVNWEKEFILRELKRIFCLIIHC